MMTEAGISPGEADALLPKLLSGEVRVKDALRGTAAQAGVKDANSLLQEMT
jgi:hypothetical protein